MRWRSQPLAFSYIRGYFKGTAAFSLSLAHPRRIPRDTLRQNVDITATRRSIYHYGVRSRDGSSESPGFVVPRAADPTQHYYSIGGIIGAINCRLNDFKCSARCRRSFCRDPLEADRWSARCTTDRIPPSLTAVEIFYGSIPDFIGAFRSFLFFFLSRRVARAQYAVG